MKYLKYLLLIILILGFAYLTTIEPDGKYFSGFAKLVKNKSKAGEDENDSLHHLDLQKLRPSFNPNPDHKD